MNDCMNAEIRDQLPELLHNRLDVARRGEILAHVAGCAACRDEIELLRTARAMFDAQTPRVDVHYVVNALPLAKPPVTPQSVRVQRRRPVWTDWRIAAAVTLLVAGGSSVAVLRRDAGSAATIGQAVQPERAVGGQEQSDSSASRTPAHRATELTPTPRATVATDAQSSGAGIGASRLGDLTEQQLETLLGEIDRLQATPITDPEPVSLRVRENTSGAPEGA